MLSYARELYRHQHLLRMWTLREIKIRYKQSFLGAAWAILQPLVLMLMFTVVFSYFARLPSDGIPYPIFSYAGLLPWTFLSTSISFAAPSLVTNMNLVTKIHFPREILPVAAVLAAFLDFLVASTVFVGLLLWYRMPLGRNVLWLPVLLGIQVMLTLGIVLLAAALTVWYRDIRFVVPLGIQLWMYASPVIYPLSLVPERFRGLYLLNPMAALIESYRRVILHGVAPLPSNVATSAVMSTALLLAGYGYFKRSEVGFADVI